MCAKCLKKGDTVVVITGKDKGKKGEIERVLPLVGKALVKGVNVVIKHVKPSQNDVGGISKKELPIDLSNLMFFDEEFNGPTRIGFKMVDNKKVRFSKKSGKVLS